MNPQEKPKEKSVLTEKDRMEIIFLIQDDAYNSAIDIAELRVLANYKKQLREKVQERTRKGGFVRDLQIIKWLLRELGDC